MSGDVRAIPNADHLERWHRRTLDLAIEGVIVVAVPCGDCRRMRAPDTMRRNPRTGEFHCAHYDDDCQATILANAATEG